MDKQDFKGFLEDQREEN